MRLLFSITALILAALLPVGAGAFMVDPSRPDAGCGGSIVVLDPGHGGEDSGAIGPGGVMEKDLTLELATRLASLLREGGGCKVLLTRTDDVFVPLEERTGFANAHRADIFISIHANSTPSKKVKGIETYFLSFDATDDDARRVAAFENSIPAVRAVEPSHEDAAPDGLEDLKDILLDLAQTEAHHESSALAEAIHTALVDSTGKENRGVKQAPFVVLTGAVMPAVLVEVGFISNPAEERWLARSSVQAQVAESISGAVLGFTRTYLTSREFVELDEEYR